jgi:hypothetical protein
LDSDCFRSEEAIIRERHSLLYRRDHTGCLLETNEPFGPGDLAPLAHIALSRDLAVFAFRAGLGSDLLLQFERSLKAVRPVHDLTDRSIDAVIWTLVEQIPAVKSVVSGPVYVVAEPPAVPFGAVRVDPNDPRLLIAHYPNTAEGLRFMQPCWAIPVDGRAVAVCRSVRVHGMHREAGADTLAEFRLRGYGTDVVAAWALDLLKADLVPLYSTNWENIGSLGIARKLKMKQLAVEFRIE